MKVALVRGAFLNRYEGQLYFPLAKRTKIVAFSSLKPIHDQFPFPVVKLPSPMDIPFGPLEMLKMPTLNRIFVDAQYLLGLEGHLRGFDIAHCADTFYHFTHQCIIAKRQGNIRKVVATIFENIPFNNEGIIGRKQFKHQALSEIDHFIAITERSKAALMLEGARPDDISVIGQRIDTSHFRPVNRRKNNEIHILFAGRLEFYKGVLEVIFAAKRLISDKSLGNFSLRFTLVGDGTLKKKCLDLISSLEIGSAVSIQSAPYEKMPEFYNSADIFVAPSRATPTYQEQFSTVLLEAQASGLPIVTTYSGGIPENVEQAALMANPGDFYSVSEALKCLILDGPLRKKLGAAARKHVMKFDVQSGSRQVEEVYRKVLAN